MGSILSEELKKIYGSIAKENNIADRQKESSEANQIHKKAHSNLDNTGQTYTENDYQKVVDKYLNGKDCFSCKVIATVNPLLLAGFTLFAYRRNKVTHLKPASRYAFHGLYLSTIGFFLTMSFLSLTGSYTLKDSEEGWSEYLRRDRQTMVNQIRSLYRSPTSKRCESVDK